MPASMSMMSPSEAVEQDRHRRLPQLDQHVEGRAIMPPSAMPTTIPFGLRSQDRKGIVSPEGRHRAQAPAGGGRAGSGLIVGSAQVRPHGIAAQKALEAVASRLSRIRERPWAFKSSEFKDGPQNCPCVPVVMARMTSETPPHLDSAAILISRAVMVFSPCSFRSTRSISTRPRKCHVATIGSARNHAETQGITFSQFSWRPAPPGLGAIKGWIETQATSAGLALLTLETS